MKTAKKTYREFTGLANKYKLLLKLSANPKLELLRIKLKTNSADLSRLAPMIFENRASLDMLYGPPFPSVATEIWSKPPVLYPTKNFLNEIVWATSRCLAYGAELRRFTELRLQYELSFLQDDWQTCAAAIRTTEAELGCSLWILQAKLVAGRHWPQNSELSKEAEEAQKSFDFHHPVRTLLWFSKRRIEATTGSAFLKEELAKALSGIDDESVRAYFHAKLFDLTDVPASAIAATIAIEGHSSLIDLYETLVLVLQSIASSAPMPVDLASELHVPISRLLKATGDLRLPAILRALGLPQPAPDFSFGPRAAIVESYTRGEYEFVLRDSEEHIRTYPADLSIFVLHHKAAQQLGVRPAHFSGILKTLSDNFTTILRLSDGAYVAAHELILLIGRCWPCSGPKVEIRANTPVQTVHADFPHTAYQWSSARSIVRPGPEGP